MQYFHLNFCKCLAWKLMHIKTNVVVLKHFYASILFWKLSECFLKDATNMKLRISLSWYTFNGVLELHFQKILILLWNRIIMFTSANGLHYSPFKCYNIIQYNSNVLLSKNKWVKHIYFQSHILQTLPLLVIENLHNNNLLSCCPINEIYMKIEELVCPEKSRLTLAWTL